MYKNIKINYGIQIIFSTIPNQNKKDFERQIEDSYFKDYKSKIKSDDYFLYKPIKCYLFGDYDVCYITLINNFKFSQKLFEIKTYKNSNNKNKYFSSHSFKSYSGYALNQKEKLENIFTNQPKEYFVSIFNLKLNNGILIGNGLEYIEAVHFKIKEILGEIPYILIQTFSWFELSLVVFSNKTSKLSEIIIKLRLLEFEELKTKTLLDNSLYSSLFENEEKINNTSIFSDTHSYVGFNNKLINTENIEDDYIQTFLKSKNIEFNTEIEWHIKPGHINALDDILSNQNELSDYHINMERKLVLGKSDYLLQVKEGNINYNFHLFRYIKSEKSDVLFKHIRKVKSYVYIKGKDIKTNSDTKKDPLLWDKKLEKLAIEQKIFSKVDRMLKSLKVSRQIRIKVLKIFSNYNNGILSPILFIYFIDFKVFIDNLIKLIEEEDKEARKGLVDINNIEKKLNKNIEVFQEGYNVRFLNGYEFENISTFDLDFNGSIQLLLTSYWSLIYEYGKMFYSDNNVSPILQLNNIDTVSNGLSINYSIHHLTSPEFVFTTLLKELLNHFEDSNDKVKKLLDEFNDNLQTFLYITNESYLDDIFKSGLIDLKYFYIDAIRFIVTFNFDFGLFFHWFWSYNFQNSSLYNANGMFNEHRLQMELLRIMLIKDFFEIDNELECPTPMLYTYWNRHINKIKSVSSILSKELKKKQFQDHIISTLKKYLGTYKNTSFNNIDIKEDLLENFHTHQNFFSRYDDYNAKSKFFSFYKKINDVHSMERMMFELLNKHYEKNKKRITILNREWENGNVMESHNKLYRDILYTIDQTGGVYFENNTKTIEYFKMNAEYILKIIDFSYKQKLKFINTNSNI